MKKIKLDVMDNVMILDEFTDTYDSAKGIKLCNTSERPSVVFEYLADNFVVVLQGDYCKADAILRYIHHYEDDLVKGEDDEYYRHYDRKMDYPAIKRLKVHRLNYIFHQNKMPFFSGNYEEENVSEWLSEDMGANYFLLPARRYMRILTDIKRADEGIKFDFMDITIYIRPFVYVPFDKSVPEMFLGFKKYIEGKTVIDVGTGTGILSIIAAKSGAKMVTAVDINPNAVSCAQKNIERNGVSNIVANVKTSDLFNEIDGNFETIIFNAPWISGKPKNSYELAIYDPEYEVITKFMEQSKKHLCKDGIILLQYSDISQKKGDGSIDHLGYLLDRHHYKITEQVSILRRNRLLGAMERVYVFVIRNS